MRTFLVLIGVLVVVLLLPGCLPWQHPPEITHEFNNFVVMKTPRILLRNDNIGRREICKSFYQHYEDEFDLILIVSNLPRELTGKHNVGFHGHMSVVRNSILGDGVRQVDRGKRFGSAGRLKGIIELPIKEYVLRGPMLHEIMHLWISDVQVIPTAVPGHWGFSSVHGQLGGFDRHELVQLGVGMYSAGPFGIVANFDNTVRYSALELYLAGWIPPSEVPEVLIAEDAAWYVEERGNSFHHFDLSSNPIFTATSFSTWSIDRIIEELGDRIPTSEDSQKSFRLATIVLENESFPFTEMDMELMSHQIELFTREESVMDERARHLGTLKGIYNFWEATGGRATINAEVANAKRTH